MSPPPTWTRRTKWHWPACCGACPARTRWSACCTTYRSRWLRIAFWVNFGLTVVATLYFGWHYIADDIAGVTIAFLSFYLAGLATGQKFDHAGLSSHPTSTTSRIPVSQD